jgi:formylglycine-generating enzyme required for sulfatase activity
MLSTISCGAWLRVTCIMAVTASYTILPQSGCAQSRPATTPATAPAGREIAAREIVRDSIPGTLITFELVLVPGGSVTLDAPSGRRTVRVDPFYIGRTEVTWDMYDVYMLRLDEAKSSAAADAVARPSMPYAVPDYEWGHDGYAAISIARGAAQTFAEWLSARTGHRYRLPTEAEWVHAASLAGGSELTRERIDAIAWHRDNAERKTHPIASREPDALGLFDLFGNAAEWVMTEDGGFVTRGGSFRDDPAAVGAHARAEQDRSWTERDPQIPSSVWWLSDAPFVGFRIVREAQPAR